MPDLEPNHEPVDPALDDTVADEEAVEPAPPPVPPPPPPVFREAAPDALNGLAPEPPRPVPRPPPAGERASKRRWRDDLGNTPNLEDSRMGAIRSGDVERLHMDDIFDRPEYTSAAAIADYDPEAGRTSVSVKVQVVREAVRSATSTPFGRLMLALPLGLVTIVLIIMAITVQDRWMWVSALLVTPFVAWLLYVRYQTWLGHKRYMYRLLESLGEDVSDFDASKTYRRVGRSLRK